MADILIRGMKMPKSCWCCPCSDKRRAVCGITGFGIWFSYRRRSKDCPLIALPEPPKEDDNG